LKVVPGSASQTLSYEISRSGGLDLLEVERRVFPDGELLVRIKDEEEVSGEEILVVQSTPYPQERNLMELLQLIDSSISMGAERVIALVPYLCYSRQDKRFRQGEPLSSRIVVDSIFSAGADELITVNIHEEGILRGKRAKSLRAEPEIGRYFSGKLDDPLVLAPDKGAIEIAKAVSKEMKSDYSYLEKERNLETGEISVKGEVNAEGRDVLIVDDMISTGGTVIEAARISESMGAKRIMVSCIHPVLVQDALLRIYSSGVERVVSTNTIEREVSEISIHELILRELVR